MKIRRAAVFKALAAAALLILAFNNNARRLVRQEMDKRKMLSRISAFEKENKALAEELRLLETDDEYYSAVVRRELGMLKPGEVEYRFSGSGRPSAVTRSRRPPSEKK